MRASTLAFLLIFAGVFGHLRQRQAIQAQGEIEASSAEQNRSYQARQLKSQMVATEREFRHGKAVKKDLEASLRELQDVAQSTRTELARSLARSDPSETIERRRQNLRRLEQSLEEVLRGHRRLILKQERLEGERATLDARLQLARAGLLDDDDSSAQTDHTVPSARPSPLDALSHLTSFQDR